MDQTKASCRSTVIDNTFGISLMTCDLFGDNRYYLDYTDRMMDPDSISLRIYRLNEERMDKYVQERKEFNIVCD